MKPSVKIGVVGAGAIAQVAHLPALARMRGAELVALCDNDRAKARALAERFAIPDVFTDIEDVLELSSFLRNGELGKLTAVRAGHLQPKRVAEGWRYRRAEAGGGAFMEHGLPLLDLALWLADFPEPVRVSARMERGRATSAV